MSIIFNFLKKIFCILPYLPKTIYFNFHYLPVKQAVKLPIWLYNARFKSLRGKVIIDCDSVKIGMIHLGGLVNNLYANIRSGIVWDNNGGVVVFHGTCIIGNNSAISVGKNGKIELGDNFIAGTSMKICSMESIIIGENCRFAWENIIIDTDFHSTINRITGHMSTKNKEIRIGNNNWIGIRCLVLKGTETPSFCIFGAGSTLNKKYDAPEYSMLAGTPLKVIKENVYRDLQSFVE